MKIKHLLLGMLAMAATVACKPDQPVEEATLEVSKETVALAATAAEATFEVTSNQDWTATADADWVTLDPATGAASAEAVVVKVTAEDNETAEARTATVTVTAGELTKTVALTQAGTEPEPEPELPTPNVDWTSDAVVSYDLPESASSKRQLLKNIKYTFDENYLYVKLQASAAEFAAAPAEYLGIFVYDVTNGSGDGYYGWWNDAKGNVELEGEHIGVFSGKDITLTIGETPVEVITEENGDELVWTMNILRSAHENLALENPYFAFLTYIGWEPNGALPDKYENMLQYTPATTPEPEPEPEPEPVDVDIDGKQWLFTWNAMGGASCVIDLGVTEPGVAILAYDMGVLDPSYAGIVYPYIMGTYTVTKTDGTSGVVTLTVDGMTAEIPYSNATENSVHFATAALLEEDVDCTLATSKVDIYLEVAEYLPDGEYWIIADGKVARPLTSNYGYLQVMDAVDGKSYAANAFTFTMVDAGLYTIQDANGKYYYQSGTYNSFNVSDKDGGTDEYLWEVYDTGNGEFAIINYAVGKYVQLDSQYGTFGSYADEKGTLPTLVAAVDPIPEPEPEDPSEGELSEYATNVTCKTVSSAYTDGVATVNGTANVFTLKLGTSKLNGKATVTLPAGTTSVSYYAVGWKGTSAKLQFSVDGAVVATQAIAANTGATGNAPYTMTVADTDKYTLTFDSALAADTEVTVETTGSAYRAILFGIQAK